MGLRGFISCCRGGAAAEMALISPLAVILLFTALEAGHYLYVEHQVVKGLRDGARFAARQSFDDINCRSGPTITTGVSDAVKNLVRTGQISGGTSRVSGWQASDITVSVTCPTAAEAQAGIFEATEPAAQVNVVTSFNYNSIFNGLGLIDDTAPLAGTQQATVMGI